MSKYVIVGVVLRDTETGHFKTIKATEAIYPLLIEQEYALFREG
jgi:hypothetical protein